MSHFNLHACLMASAASCGVCTLSGLQHYWFKHELSHTYGMILANILCKYKVINNNTSSELLPLVIQNILGEQLQSVQT